MEIQKIGIFWRNCRARWLICSNLWFIVAALLNRSSSSSDCMRKHLPCCITIVPHVLANSAKIWRIIKVSISRQMSMGAWSGVRISVSPRTSLSYQSFEKFWKTSFFCVETLTMEYLTKLAQNTPPTCTWSGLRSVHALYAWAIFIISAYLSWARMFARSVPLVITYTARTAIAWNGIAG